MHATYLQRHAKLSAHKEHSTKVTPSLQGTDSIHARIANRLAKKQHDTAVRSAYTRQPGKLAEALCCSHSSTVVLSRVHAKFHGPDCSSNDTHWVLLMFF